MNDIDRAYNNGWSDGYRQAIADVRGEGDMILASTLQSKLDKYDEEAENE